MYNETEKSCTLKKKDGKDQLELMLSRLCIFMLYLLSNTAIIVI